MAAEEGFHTIVQADLDAKQVVITPVTTPTSARARIQRTVGSQVFGVPRAVTLPGNGTLVIPLTARAKVGDDVFWTSYS